MFRNLLMLCFCISVLAIAQDAPQAPQQNVFNAIKALKETSLVTANGKLMNGAEVLKGKKLIGLYFSAHWCGPCRMFTPELVTFRHKCLNNNLPFDVIFVSSDNDEKAMRQYMLTEGMRWCAVPYSSGLSTRLKSEFKVQGIPTLILLDGNGKVFSKDARWDVAILKEKAYQYWMSPNYKPLTYQDYQNKNSVKSDIKKDAHKDSKKKSQKDTQKDSKKESHKNSKKDSQKNTKKDSKKNN